MFGQSSTPFGSTGGGFGQQSTNTPAPGLFGTPAPAFGAPAPATGFGGFGAPPPAPSGGLFGSNPAPAPTFGAPQDPFGQASTGFGQTPAPTGGLFGTTPAPAPFGARAPAPSIFGAPAPSTSPFGAPAAGSTFGAPAPSSGFGGTAGFGTAAPAPTFGAQPGGIFGTAPAPPPAFGAAPTSTFGTGSTFGVPAPAPGGIFGAPAPASAGIFGSPATAQPQGVGTRGVPYQVTNKQDGNSSINLQAITAMPAYIEKSFEELRFEDYSEGNRGSASSTPTSSTTGAFSFAQTPAPTGGLFTPTPAAAPFGQPGRTTFGQPAPAPFGQSAPAPFGQAAPSPFGQPPASSGLFGAPAPPAAPFLSGFGTAPTPAAGGMFGTNPTAPAPAFGQAPAFGAPAPGVFGNSPAPAFGAPAPSTGIFGSSPAPGFGSPAAAPPFGAAPAPTGFAGFGAPSPGGLFGPAPAPGPFGAFAPKSPAPTFGGFGAQPTPAPLFQQPAPAPLFGQQPGTTQPFAQTPGFAPGAAAMPTAVIPPNAVIIPPAANEVVEQQLRAMEKQRQELEKVQVWSGGRAPQAGQSPGTRTTPTSLPEPEGLLPGSSSNAYSLSPYAAPSMSISPSSGSKLRPRGFPKTETTTSSAKSPARSLVGRDKRSVFSPEAAVRSNVMNLQIKPDSLKKHSLRLKLENGASGSSLANPSSAASPDFAETLTSPPTEGTVDVTTRTGTGTTPQPAMESAPSPRETQSPAATPGYDYYQSVIHETGVPTSEPAAPVSPAASNLVPILTKSGYEVTPSLEDLASMPEAGLAAVTGFSVSHRCAKIEWEGSVDVRGANLDRIVNIEQQDVSVYMLEEEAGTKPPIGTMLNRPAKITFFDVFPRKGRASASEDDMEKFARKLSRTTAKIGADFVSYDRSSGTWIIRAHHFSRYAFLDDDDDDEDTEDEGEVSAVGQSQIVRFDETTVQDRPRSILQRKPTPYKTGRFQLSVQENDMSEGSEEDDVAIVSDFEMTEPDNMEAVRIEAEKAAADVMSVVRVESPPTQLESRPMLAKAVNFDDEGQEDENLDEQPVEIHAPGNSEFRQAASGNSFTSKLSQALSLTSTSVDSSLNMRNSFRVCWLPNGSLFIPQKQTSEYPRLVKHRPILTKKPIEAEELLKVHIGRTSRIDGCSANKCNLLELRGTPQTALYDTLMKLSAAPDSEEARNAFLLLACLLETRAKTEERAQAVLKWLVSLCAPHVESEIGTAHQHNDYMSAVFAALSGGDVDRACDLAFESGCPRLAAVMAVGVEGRKDLINELVLLSQSGHASHIHPITLGCLQSISGDTNPSSRMNWLRHLVLRLLPEPDEDFATTFRALDRDVTCGKAPYPAPLHLGSTPSNCAHESLLYRLLHLCTSQNPTISVLEAVDPQGFTSNPHDFAISFHLGCAIAAAGFSAFSPAEAEHIISGYEAQLVRQDHWELAVAVSLSCFCRNLSMVSKQRKVERAKALVLRFFDPAEQRAEARRSFLEEGVGLPANWFSEAIGQRAAMRGDVVAFVANSLGYDPAAALSGLENFWLPNVFFMSKSDVERLMPTLKLAGVEDSLSFAMYQFFKINERIHALSGQDRAHIDEALPSLREMHNNVEQTLLSVRLREQCNSVHFVPNLCKTIPLSSMVMEARHHLSLLKSQLDAL